MTQDLLPAVHEDLAVEDAEDDRLEHDQYLVFRSGNQEYGIRAIQVQEISALLNITRLPKAPPFIEGILNLRGRLVSVLDFGKRLGLDSKYHEDTRIVIVEHGGFPVALVVDSVEEVVRIPDDKFQKLPEEAVNGAQAEFMTGVGMLENRLIILLDADKLLSPSEWRALAGVPEAPAAAPAGKP